MSDLGLPTILRLREFMGVLDLPQNRYIFLHFLDFFLPSACCAGVASKLYHYISFSHLKAKY